MGNRFGLTDLLTKGNGEVTGDVGRGYTPTMTGIRMRENSRMTSSMASGSTRIERGTSTEGTGRTIRRMGQERSMIMEGCSSKERTKRGGRTEGGNTCGQTGINTKGSGGMTISAGTESTFSTMVEGTRENG